MFRSTAPARPASAPARAVTAPADAQTLEIEPPRRLTISYAPQRDNAPDGGEIVWTWVPYEERDGRGKDRPVLVIGRADATRSYAVRLTSKPHDGDRQYLSLGTGEWDPQRRPSWVDIEQLYLVHDAGMRREAAALDRRRFDTVAAALTARYGWKRG
ncbi:PemK domain-containing protein [Microbacterium testaceum]|uniref:PemK domain-containing protein n=2 Tax=Microbacteriaceae TaxID=85023 RepID=A0A147F618_MICTE|nr:PemK domain-containing protein [Microbacterium testaceum]